MKELHELKEKLCDELREYGRKEVTGGNLDVIDKLAHAIKNIDKIIEYSEEEGYSYGEPRSYARRRDSRGRYSSRGYSYHSDMDSLREMMENAPNESIRQDYQRIMQKMENM